MVWDIENSFAAGQEVVVLACEAQAKLGEPGITVAGAGHIRMTAARFHAVKANPLSMRSQLALSDA